MEIKKISLNLPKIVLQKIDEFRKKQIPILNRTQVIIKATCSYIKEKNKENENENIRNI